LANLEGCRSIRVVDLKSNPKVTTVGLKSLTKLAGLTALHLRKTGVDDRIAELFPSWPQLEDLNLNDTETTQAAFANIKLPKLRSLELSTHFSDEGIAIAAKSIPNLESINIVGIFSNTDCTATSLNSREYKFFALQGLQ
jgi:hypothetical protein